MTPAVRRGRQVAAGRATTWPGPAPTQAAAAPALAQVPRSVQRRRSTSRPAPNNHCATSHPATTWANPRSGERHGREPGSHPAGHSRDDPVVTGLLTQAKDGDRQAWYALIDRYAPLVWSICRRHRLEAADAQTVWLKLVDHLDKIREPAALPGWLATTTQHECGRILRTVRRSGRAGHALAETIADDHAQTAEQDLVAAGRYAALRGAFGQLPSRLPAAARPAHRGPASAVRRDQRQVGHPGRQNRADPPPLPGTSYAATRPSPR
jgi:DNA-directed RNA polymerase specialized sigma24 family protein